MKNCNYNKSLDLSKKNLQKLKEIRNTGKITRLNSEVEACSVQNTFNQNIPIPLWYPKRVPTRISLNELPTIPTSKIVGTFGESSDIIVDGGSP